jgi:hypothetical protein
VCRSPIRAAHGAEAAGWRSQTRRRSGVSGAGSGTRRRSPPGPAPRAAYSAPLRCAALRSAPCAALVGDSLRPQHRLAPARPGGQNAREADHRRGSSVRRQDCWRCRCEVVMLDEAEYRPIHRLVLAGVRAVNAGTGGDAFAAARAEYERITGTTTEGSSFTHHRLGHFGPPCTRCGRPLRTVAASYCVECGAESDRTRLRT